MPESEAKQKLLSFIDQHKYEAGELFSKLAESPELAEQLRSMLQPIANNAGWPDELRTWRALLLGLLGNEIGGIASPMLRKRAAEELFDVASGFGISRPAIEMIANSAYEIRQELASYLISNT